MRCPTLRAVVTLALTSAIYGSSAGAVHSLLYASRNLIKCPLLILGTTAVCALCYAVMTRFASVELSFREVQRAVVAIFGRLSLLLAACSPAVLFLALTIEPPESAERLGEYPLFLTFNVLLIGAGGGLSVLVEGRGLMARLGLSGGRIAALIGAWLLVSLLVGAQWAWYLRPFFGVSAVEDTPFCLGTAPDFRGATSFYEAVWHVLSPPG